MERELLFRFKTARDAVHLCDDALKSAREEERLAEAALIEDLEARRSSATGKYDGVWAQINKPRLYASAPQDVLPQVLEWLRTHDHASAIKETVHPSTLSQIVGEQLQNGGEVPPGVTHYFKPQVAIYGGTP